MNFWPFSKKTKVGKSQTSDLPPGVVLALSENEVILNASPAAKPSDLPLENPPSDLVSDEQAFAPPPLPLPTESTEAAFPQEAASPPPNTPSLNQSLAAALEEALAQSMRPLALSDTGSILAQPTTFDPFPISETSDGFPSGSQEPHPWPVTESFEESAEDFGLPMDAISVWPSESEEGTPSPDAFPDDDEEEDESVSETVSAPDSLASVLDTFYTEAPSDWDWGSLSPSDAAPPPDLAEPSFCGTPAFVKSEVEGPETEALIEVEAEAESHVSPTIIQEAAFAPQPQPVEFREDLHSLPFDEHPPDSYPEGGVPSAFEQASPSDLQPEPVEARKDLHHPLSDSYADVPLPDTDGQSFLSAENESLIVHMENFERGVIQQEAKFLKRSIDNLVDAYFARQESEPS